MTVTIDCDQNETVTNAVIDEAWLINRLEDAGRTLIALKNSGYSPKLAQPRHDIVHSIWDMYSWTTPQLRTPAPDREAIKAMEQAYEWVLLIPQSEAALRRIVHARSLRHPISDRYIVSWRSLAETLRTDHLKVQRMHKKALKFILKGIPNVPRIR